MYAALHGVESQTCDSAEVGAFWDLRIGCIVSLPLGGLAKLLWLTKDDRVCIASLMRMITIDLVEGSDITCKLEVGHEINGILKFVQTPSSPVTCGLKLSLPWPSSVPASPPCAPSSPVSTSDSYLLSAGPADVLPHLLLRGAMDLGLP